MRVRRIHSTLLAVALGLAGALVVAPGANGADAWGPTVDLTDPAEWVGPPDAAAGSRGGTVAAWVRGAGGGAHVWTARRDDRGGWADARRVAGTRGALEVDLEVAGDGEWVLVWTAGRQVKAARRAAGQGWTVPVVLHRTRPGVLPAFVDLAVDARGRAAVAWQTADDDADAVRIRSRVQAVTGAATGIWSPVSTLSGPRESVSPEVVIDRRGRSTVAWAELGRHRSRVVSASTVAGARWGDTEPLSRWGQIGSPHLAGNAAGELAVAWYVRGRDLRAIRVRHWSPATGWQPARSVPGVSVDVWWLDAGMDAAGAVTVGWTNAAHAVWSASRPASGAWVRQRVAGPGSVFYGLELTVGQDGGGLLGWESGAGGDHPVVVARRSSATAAWGNGTRLSAVPGDSFGPALALERDGDATAVWTFARNIDRPARVQARTHDAG